MPLFLRSVAAGTTLNLAAPSVKDAIRSTSSSSFSSSPSWRRRVQVLVCTLMSFAAIAPTYVAARAGDLEMRTRALELVNQERRHHGLQPLEFGQNINEAALSHASDMLRRDYYSHSSPEGETVQDRYVNAGGSKWRLTAENIARCATCTSPPDIEAVERLHRGWMNSPGHRENILHRGLTQFGFGVVSSLEQGQYAVQTFAGPGTSRGAKAEEQAFAISPSEQINLALSRINDARVAEDRSSLESSTALADVAKSVIATSDAGNLEIDRDVNPYQHLPTGQRQNWQSISFLMAACGGCGTDLTRADVRYFTQRWLDSAQYRERLLRSTSTHIGLALTSNGDGKKVAVLILGDRRRSD